MHNSNYGTQHGKQEVTSWRRVSCLGDVLITLCIFALVLFLMLDSYSGGGYHSPILQSIVEIRQLELAVELYKIKFGEPPPHTTDPNEIVEHLNRVIVGAQIDPDNFPHDLTTLDEREALCFWLDGKMMKEVCRRKSAMYFDFEAGRLRDTDRDGWLEFHDLGGACYILRDGKILLFDPTTGSVLSSEQLSEGQRFKMPEPK